MVGFKRCNIMRLTNNTDFPDKRIREIIEFVRPNGISNFDVMIKNSDTCLYRGRCYYNGSSFHRTTNPFIVVRITKNEGCFPLYRTTKKGSGYIPSLLLSREEALVHLIAHELKHLRQARVKRGHRVWGARGQFSERDADRYTIRKTRKWRSQKYIHTSCSESLGILLRWLFSEEMNSLDNDYSNNNNNNNNNNTIIPIESSKQQDIEVQQTKGREKEEQWTTEYLVDELFLHLAAIKEIITGCNGREIPVRKYCRQARELIRWIPIARPAPDFVINISDLTPRLKSELASIADTPKTLQYTLMHAVARIFENLDFEYYHLSIAKKLKVRLGK
jgi:hypothetical protein